MRTVRGYASQLTAKCSVRTDRASSPRLYCRMLSVIVLSLVEGEPSHWAPRVQLRLRRGHHGGDQKAEHAADRKHHAADDMRLMISLIGRPPILAAAKR